MQSGARGGEGGVGRGFMEDKGAAASGVEVTEEGRETYERGREHRVDLPLGESEVREPKVLPKTTSAANICIFCGHIARLWFETISSLLNSPHALVQRSRVVIPQRVVLDATTWGSETLSCYLATT